MSMLEIIVSKILIPFWKPISFVLLIGGSAYAGWEANTYYSGYQQSIEQQIAKKLIPPWIKCNKKMQKLP